MASLATGLMIGTVLMASAILLALCCIAVIQDKAASEELWRRNDELLAEQIERERRRAHLVGSRKADHD